MYTYKNTTMSPPPSRGTVRWGWPTCRRGGTITVALSKLQNGVAARWFDPRANTFKAIPGSPFSNTGAQKFMSPGKNSAGEPDWLLVLER